MSTKTEKDKTKQLQDKCQSVLNDLLRDEDNKYCVDCDSKGPRWASWNIGVFLCIRCAGIHRNLGVHISKVKSVNLDAWTPEQVVSLQQMGNSRARAVYEANLPDNFRRPQNDSSLESFIRAKYEHKKYIAREWVPPTLPKVNWEKEIDEEIEKQKRKKKTTVEKKPIANVEVPQLPKPKNPSPKPGRVIATETKKENDLLGLQNGEDNFSGFLSAPTSEEKKKEEEKSAKSEEESFFNQIAPTEKEKVKLTKDSILALYSNAPANNFNQFQSQMPYQTNFPVQNFQSFGGYPQQQNFPVGQFANPQWGAQSQFPVAGQLPAAPVAQFPVANQFQNGPDNIDTEQTLKYVSKFEQFIERNQSTYLLSAIETQKSFTVDYKYITSDEDELCNEWQNLKTQIVSNTEYCLNCMSLAMHQTIMNDFNKTHGDIEEGNGMQKKNLGIIRARLINYEPIQQLKEIRVNYYGKLVSVRGTVIKAAGVKIMCQYQAFSCSTCTGVQIVKQNEGIFTPPTKCITENCRAQSNFNPLHASPYTRTINWQAIKIQELVGNDEYEMGRVPRTLECELTEDLVNSCVPGDDITITGVIKVRNNTESCKKNQQNGVFLLYLDVISVVNNKNHTQGSYGASERITFNITDYYAIQKIHAEPHLFRFLVHSLCPTIYGHEVVKAGLLLALFGGTKSSLSRAESHVLMVGDPGLGKSQMLQACTNVAPRGVYVCGNTSTGSGLTVTMARESGGEYALEAGALMLADQGCCCIDEFDKMPTQHACLLEAMEQQSISIAKAGIVCTLPTRATILAAANPAGGHYNKAKTIAENLKISSPMLSRFDLIFIILDQPNEELDMMLSEHVLALHSGKSVSNSSFNRSSSLVGNTSLRGRLRLTNGEEIDHLPHSLFRKYIAYAQKYVNPQLSDEAKQVLNSFYFKLRKQFQTGDCTPVTTRQLNSLIRLTQARAKAELREEATEADALDVVEIMKESLVDIFTDDVGVMDSTRSHNGTGMSTKNQVTKLLRLMQQKSDTQTKAIFTTNEIRELSESAGICRSKFYTVLQSLNIQGFILNKGSNRYQLVTADL